MNGKGTALLTDLGIAKRIDRTETALTMTGQLPGTFEYMAPEQLSAPDSVDQRADLYSLGVTFYEVLTGERPVGAWLPASATNASIPVAFDAVLARLLARRPEERYAGIRDVLVDLQQFRSSGGSETFGKFQGECGPGTTPPTSSSGSARKGPVHETSHSSTVVGASSVQKSAQNPAVPTMDPQEEYATLIAERQHLNRLSLIWGAPGFIFSHMLCWLIVWGGSTIALWFIPYHLAVMALLLGLGLYSQYKGRHPAWGFSGIVDCAGILLLAVLPDRRKRRLDELKLQLGPPEDTEPRESPDRPNQRVFPPMFWLATGLAVLPWLAPVGLFLAIVELRKHSNTPDGRPWWTWAAGWCGWQTVLLLLNLTALTAGDAPLVQPISAPTVLSDGVFEMSLPAGWSENPSLAASWSEWLTTPDPENNSQPLASYASLIGTSDLGKDLHVLVVSYNKLDKGLIDTILRGFAGLSIERSFLIASVSEYRQLSIGEYPAIQVVVDTFDGVAIGTFVETPTHYYAIWAGGVEPQFSEFKRLLYDTVTTFRVPADDASGRRSNR